MTEPNDTFGTLPYISTNTDEQIAAPGLDVQIDLQDGGIMSVSTYDFEETGMETDARVTVGETEFFSGKDVDVEGEDVIVLSIGSAGLDTDKMISHELGASLTLRPEDAAQLRDQLDELIGDE